MTRNIGKHFSSQYSQQIPDHAKKIAADVFKTTSKRTFQKTAQSTNDLIGNKTASKIIKVSWILQHEMTWNSS